MEVTGLNINFQDPLPVRYTGRCGLKGVEVKEIEK